MAPGGPQNILKLPISINFDPLGVYQTLWGHVRKHCVKFSPLETLWGSRLMTIVGFHVGPHIPDIEYFEVYEGTWGYMTVYGPI